MSQSFVQCHPRRKVFTKQFYYEPARLICSLSPTYMEVLESVKTVSILGSGWEVGSGGGGGGVVQI